jgi:Transglycosylase SLT domain
MATKLPSVGPRHAPKSGKMRPSASGIRNAAKARSDPGGAPNLAKAPGGAAKAPGSQAFGGRGARPPGRPRQAVPPTGPGRAPASTAVKGRVPHNRTRVGGAQPRKKASLGKVLKTTFQVKSGAELARAARDRDAKGVAWNGTKLGVSLLSLKVKLIIAAVVVAALILVVALVLSGVAVVGIVMSANGSSRGEGANLDIPPAYLALYQDAVMRPEIKAKCPELPWQFVAAIGWRESNHGASQLPGVHSSYSLYEDGRVAGAAGPMQIGALTGSPAGNNWARYGVDGDGDGDEDVYDPKDAIPAGTMILCDYWRRHDASTSHGTLWKAAFAYNQGPNKAPYRTLGYVEEVVLKFQEYTTAAMGSTGPWVVDGKAGPLPGHAAIPPPAQPYLGGATGCSYPDPTGNKCLTAATNHGYHQIRAAFGDRWKYFECFSYRAPNSNGYVGEHPLGRACDIGPGTIGRHPTEAEKANGWALAGWLRANAGALKVWYVIYQGRIWNIHRQQDEGGQWGHRYTANSGVTGGHYDHVHVSFTM